MLGLMHRRGPKSARHSLNRMGDTMRKNTQDVFHSWQYNHHNHKQASIWTNGRQIGSYGTTLVTCVGNTLIFNATKYSPTTSRHQAGLRALLASWDSGIVEVDGLPFGATSDDLEVAAGVKLAEQEAQERAEKLFDLVGSIMTYEEGELDEDAMVDLFQRLVDSGMAWQLQGSYGSMAKALIEQGLVFAR